MKILIVDDDSHVRRILSKVLDKAGYEVSTAMDGIEAWDILQNEYFGIVITDWMMPKMDGLELCKKIRSRKFPHYVFIILLTAKDAKDDLIEGLQAGADDFLIKPSNKNELKARIRSCERILTLERDLEDRNKKLIESNQKLNQAYLIIEKDLQSAAKIQVNLLPKSDAIIYGVQFDWIFLPSTYVAGDIFSYFKLDEYHIAFYLLDVAGHGIPAAMLSVTLSNMLSPVHNEVSILKKRIKTAPFYKIINPAKVISDLNLRFQLHGETMQYFTMIYGIIDARDGRTVFTQAGHPPPIYLSNGSNTTLIGDGGYPVGMFPDLDYDEKEIFLEKGDSLTLYSDGITECMNNKKEQFSTERLMKLLKNDHNQSLHESMKNITKELKKWNGNDKFKDDISLLTINIL